MILSPKKLFVFYLLFFGLPTFAQKETPHNKLIDEYVKKLGTLDSLNMGTIAAKVTKPFTDKKDIARAVFDWIVFNISFDCKAARSGNTQKNSVADVLLYRKATALGYADLFQDMCSAANVRCLVPDGYIKTGAEQIGDSKTDINHSWAVVQLGQSPDEWFYVDPAWGSGSTDAEMKVFTPSFNDAFFFADKTIFNWQHYPDNEGWKLGPAPKTKKDFYALPVIGNAAYDFRLTSFSPVNGHIIAKASKPVSLSFKIDDTVVISKVTLLKGERKKIKEVEIPFTFNNGTLSINCKFEEGSSYPLTVRVNGKNLVSYMVDVE